MKIVIINIYILLAVVIFCRAQPHQIILQLDEDITIDQLKSSQTISPFASYQQLSESLNIWLIEIPAASTTLKKESILTNLKEHPHIKTAQLNEAVELRNTPNDMEFADQWQYNNTGEALGIMDADMDALKAWNLTTGGKTALGDEIVVAIIDGGVDLNHLDLINNLWTNNQEIPNNQIDDDQNGYVDDYYGWNFNKKNGDVGNGGYGHFHGTPVAGIIGAEGNNYKGVCGVNWQVKIMNLAANRTVANVIEAYDYVLNMRKRYSATNGQQGAFVVATNASLGIDYGKPADHPLWCAMYNALGEAGVINVAATADLFINVDLRGDIPTTCSSDFLISVTNTNNRDELAIDAAYGRRHIDLSAPGNGTFTTINNSGYGGFGGTSAAAPHVAGAVALLYATPNQNFMQTVQQNPSAAALLVKDFILNGADPIADLYYKSVTNGRLNLFNSLCELENYFDSNSCVEAEEVFLQLDKLLINNANREMHIHFEMQGKSSLKIRLFNSAGALVHQQILPQINSGRHKLQLSSAQLINGIYFLNIDSKNASLNQSILIQ